MKKFITALLSTIACVCNMHAQEYMIVEQKDGIKKEFKINDVDRVYFEARQEPVQLTCPDGNHPHAIDLGLPSGTKWCCCNVGASRPEDYGGYYAWGETSEKSVYSFDTYAFYDNTNDKCINIGSDISGTQYDVAYVRMGDPWRMPTDGQQMELMKYCTQVWTQRNGVNGILVTGSNGGQVFLSAAGSRWYGDLHNAGSDGSYRSSSLSPYDGNFVYGLDFNSGNRGWCYYYRYIGQSVRPVCP